MKKQALFIVLLASLSAVAVRAETGGLSWLVPSALASDAGSTHQAEGKHPDGAGESDDGGHDGALTCICPPGITSCTCPDGSAGKTVAGSISTAPGALRSVYGK